jgi:cell volume regulation protein A
VSANSLYMRQSMFPSWAKLTLVVRDERVLSTAEAGAVREGDYVYFLAPPDRAQALDRFFVDAPAPARPDQRLLGDFYVSGDATLGALSEIYGVPVPAEEATVTLANHIQAHFRRPVHVGDRLALGPIELIVDRVENGRATTIGLDLAEPHVPEAPPPSPMERAKQAIGGWVRRRR